MYFEIAEDFECDALIFVPNRLISFLEIRLDLHCKLFAFLFDIRVGL
jgi:hypothetical protein